MKTAELLLDLVKLIRGVAYLDLVEAGRGYQRAQEVAAGGLTDYASAPRNEAETGGLSNSVTVTVPRLPAARKGIGIILDDNPLHADVAPVIVEGRTLLPVRAIAEALGAEVGGASDTRTVTLSLGDTVVRPRIDDTTALVNDVPVTLDVPAQVTGGRTLVPVRFISEAFGVTVDWDPAAQTVLRKTSLGVPGVPALASPATHWITRAGCSGTGRARSALRPSPYPPMGASSSWRRGTASSTCCGGRRRIADYWAAGAASSLAGR